MECPLEVPQEIIVLSVDLMDRSKLQSALPHARFVRDLASVVASDPHATVIIDLARFPDAVAGLRAQLPSAFIVAFGPHVDTQGADDARAAGADRVLPRSRFFRDPAGAVDPATDG